MAGPRTLGQTKQTTEGPPEAEQGLRDRLAEAAKASCICADCPSYVGTDETALVFCIIGKSDIIADDKGCTCRECPVQDVLALRWHDYCFKGSASELLAREA